MTDLLTYRIVATTLTWGGSLSVLFVTLRWGARAGVGLWACIAAVMYLVPLGIIVFAQISEGSVVDPETFTESFLILWWGHLFWLLAAAAGIGVALGLKALRRR